MRWLPLLILLCSCSSPAPPAPDPPPVEPQREGIQIVHIPDKLANGAQYQADWSFDIYDAGTWSLHVHVIPPGQLVPLHHHPHNDELSFIAAGEAHCDFVSATERTTATLAVGDALVARQGEAHAVRNPGRVPEGSTEANPGHGPATEGQTLAVAVLHRPRFGQNWFLRPDEVTHPHLARALRPGDAVPEGLFTGWDVTWRTLTQDAPPQTPQGEDLIYLIATGSGIFAVDDHRVPLAPGTAVHVPAGRTHQLLVGDGQITLLAVRIPR